MVAKYDTSTTPFGQLVYPPPTEEEEEEEAQEEQAKREETEAKEPRIEEMAYAGDTVLDWIIDRVWGIFWVFYDLSITLSGVWWIGDWLATPFSWVADRIYGMLSPLYEFRRWVGNVSAKLVYWWTELDIWNLLTIPISWAERAWEWVQNAWGFIWNEIGDWWNITKTTVLGWIDIAVEGFNKVKTEWDNFWSQTFPKLLDFFSLEAWWSGKLFGIDGLIGSRLAEWFPWYDELAQSIDGILTFFTDPAKAVYELFDYIIDRFWEED